jgi:hypothetical protein
MQRLLRFSTPVVFAVFGWLAFAPMAHAEVQLSLRDGRVTLVAKDATLRQILTEWARVGKTKVINLERIPGGPLTLELRDMPEADALDVLLRTLSGYIVAPRTTAIADASLFDSISVMPTVATAQARTVAPAPAPFAPPPAFVQNEDDQNPQQPGVRPPAAFVPFPAPPSGQQPPNPNVARPVLPVVRPGMVPPQPNVNPGDVVQPPIGAPFQVPVAPTGGQAAPGAIGVSAPGMIAPAASQPGQVPPPQRPPGD